MLKTGLTHTASTRVRRGNTALAIGSGDLPVLATPAMVAMMENAAMTAVAPHLDAGTTTVGTKIDISHVKATPLGRAVSATATLATVDGRRLDFRVEARDDAGELLGEGTHTRVIVDRDRFMAKL